MDRFSTIEFIFDLYRKKREGNKGNKGNKGNEGNKVLLLG